MAAKKAARKRAPKKAAAPAPKPAETKKTEEVTKTEEAAKTDTPDTEVESTAITTPEAVTPTTDTPEDVTKEELYKAAQEIDLEGRSSMDKEELMEALKKEEAAATPAPAKSGGKAAQTISDFVLKTLLKHFTKPVAESWCSKVVAAVEADKIVTIAEVKGSLLLEIHDTFRYQDRDSVRTLAALYGKKFKVNVNQLVRDKFPKE